MKTVPIETLKARLDYNPESGVLTWKNGQCTGKEAGCIVQNKAGNRYRYLSIGIGGKSTNLLVHRVAYALFHGFWVEEIDHLDGNGLNNKIYNLRGVSRAENNKNRRKQSNNSSGIAGVSWTERLNKFRVYGTKDGKQERLGLSPCFFEACCLRKRWEIVNCFTERHGK
jgi:hypothetical protein